MPEDRSIVLFDNLQYELSVNAQLVFQILVRNVFVENRLIPSILSTKLVYLWRSFSLRFIFQSPAITRSQLISSKSSIIGSSSIMNCDMLSLL